MNGILPLTSAVDQNSTPPRCRSVKVGVGFTLLAAIIVCGTLLASGCQKSQPVVASPGLTDAATPTELQPPTVQLSGITFQHIPGGQFTMGAVPADRNTHYARSEYPRHVVQISRDFYLSTCEITRGQFRAFVTATGYVTAAERSGLGANSLDLATGGVQQLAATTWQSPGFVQSGNHPVICVDWYDAVAFCEWLSTAHGRTFRLPTEAEWEYACRAGQTTRYSTGDNATSLQSYANIGDQSLVAEFLKAGGAAPWFDGAAFTAAVGQFRPNAFGLQDMHGNVGEWCHDWYADDYYQQSPAVDPSGPEQPTKWHSVRGGSWYNAAFSCRSSGRHDAIETAASTTNGFRVLLER